MNDHQLDTAGRGRCDLHPAYEADYCPSCGTSRRIGETTEEILARDEYVALVLAIGDGFHPDTTGADYTSLPDGYTPARVDEIVEAEFARNLRDPYAVANSVLDGARAEAVADRIRAEFPDLASFATDPGGWLAYVGTFDRVDDDTAAAAIALVLDGIAK